MGERRMVLELASYFMSHTSYTPLFFLKKSSDDTDDKKDDGSDTDSSSGKGDNGGEDEGRTTAEWVTLGVSILIVLALVGLVIYQYIAGGTRPPQIVVEPLVAEVTQAGDKYYLRISVTNSGDKAVEDVAVEIEHTLEGEKAETVSFTVPFLAGLENDEYTVVVSGDPSDGEISHTVSFHEP